MMPYCFAQNNRISSQNNCIYTTQINFSTIKILQQSCMIQKKNETLKTTRVMHYLPYALCSLFGLAILVLIGLPKLQHLSIPSLIESNRNYSSQLDIHRQTNNKYIEPTALEERFEFRKRILRKTCKDKGLKGAYQYQVYHKLFK